MLFYVFCGVTLVQLFYHWFFFAKVSFFRPGRKSQSQQHPVSVIVCARDEAANLAKNLPGVLVQQYASSHEVIVVNHNSQDETRYLLEEFRKTFKDLHIVNLEQEAKGIPGKKYPLSMGIREAKYEVVLLTDADCVPATESWITCMQDGYDEHTEVVLGYGAYHKRPGFLNKLIRYETFHSAIQYFSYALNGMPYMGTGRNLSYKKTKFLKNKGFSSINHVASGDDDLFINQIANRRNTRVVIDKAAFTLSEPKSGFGDWRRQKYRHYSTGKFYKPVHKFFLGLYSVTHVLFYPLFIVTLILTDWRWACLVLAARLLTQGIVFYKAMARLDEKDLFFLYWLFDLWMVIYYFIFAPAIWRKPKKSWA